MMHQPFLFKSFLALAALAANNSEILKYFRFVRTATMLPVCVNFEDLKSQIKIDDKQGPCICLALTLQLPLVALVDAMLDLQAKHSKLSAGATPWEPKRKPPPGTWPLSSAATPPTVASSAGESGIAKMKEKEGWMMDAERPFPESTPKKDPESCTWDTPIGDLHVKYVDYIERTTWKPQFGPQSKAAGDLINQDDVCWVMEDESPLIQFEPVPLTAPTLGRGREHLGASSPITSEASAATDATENLMAKLRKLADGDHGPGSDLVDESPSNDAADPTLRTVGEDTALQTQGTAQDSQDQLPAVGPSLDSDATEASVATPPPLPDKLPGRGNHKRDECKNQ